MDITKDLHQAINKGDLAGVIAALDAGADIEAPDIHGAAGLPLRTACFHGHTAIVAELLERGADVNRGNSDGPGAPLRMATRGRQSETIRLLLSHGAAIPPGLNIPPELLGTLPEIPEAPPLPEVSEIPPPLPGSDDETTEEEVELIPIFDLELPSPEKAPPEEVKATERPPEKAQKPEPADHLALEEVFQEFDNIKIWR